MMKKNRLAVLLAALLLGLVLSVSLLSVPAGAADTQSTVETAAEGDTDTAGTSDQDAETEPGDEKAPGDEEETTPETEEGEEEAGGLSLSFWISMGVLALLVVVAVVVGIMKRESLGKWWRSYKSELNKIVWMPWRDVRKNTAVVIVVVVVIGVIIGLLDYVFSRGIIELGNIVRL